MSEVTPAESVGSEDTTANKNTGVLLRDLITHQRVFMTLQEFHQLLWNNGRALPESYEFIGEVKIT